MKKWLGRIGTAVVSSLAVSSLVGITVLAAFSAPLTIIESSGNSYDMLATWVGAPITWLANNGYIQPDGLDTRVQTAGGVNRPHLLTTEKILTANAIGANSQTNLSFTTGNTDLEMPIITGYNGYFSKTDDLDMELGDDFEIETKGYVDTSAGADKNIVYKEDAFRTYIDGATNITSEITYSDTIAFRPDSAGDETNITDQFPASGSHWDKVDEESADDDTTYVYSSTDSVWKRDLYNLPASSQSGTITKITLYFRVKGYYNVLQAKGVIKSDSTVTETAGKNPCLDFGFGVWGTYSQDWSTNPADGLAWEWADIDNLQIGVSLYKYSGYNPPACTQVYVVVSYLPSVSVTATGISSDEHVVTTNMDWPFFGIEADSTTGITLPVGDTAGDLVLNTPLWQDECNADPFTSIDSYGHSCDVTGAVWTPQGYSFDGIDDYIEVVHHASQLLTTGGTIEAWIKPNTWGEVRGYVVDKSTGEGGVNGWEFRLSETVKTIAFKINGGTTKLGASNSVVLMAWSHVVATWNNTGYVTIYVNGVQSGTPGISADLTGITTTNPLTIGNRSGATDRTFDGLIGGVLIYNRALTPAEIARNYNATKWKYQGDTDRMVKSTTATVLNNNNTWYFDQNNVMPYMDYYKHTVGGSEIVWYQPKDIIVDAGATGTLPDLEATGGSEDATITWGSNPAGVAVTLGSMVSTAQPSLMADTDEPARDIMPEIQVTDWFKEPAVAGSLLTNPLRPLITMVSDNTTLTELQTWRLFGLAIVLLVTVGIARLVPKHLAVACFAGGASVVALVVLTIWPIWALVLLVLYGFGGWISERAPSL